jgi:hypothetical protein
VIVMATAIGLAMDFGGLDPIRGLYLAAILNGWAAPPLILSMMLLSNDERTVGRWLSEPWSNALVELAFVAMGAAPVASLVPRPSHTESPMTDRYPRCVQRDEQSTVPSTPLPFASLRLGRFEVGDLNVIERILSDDRVGPHMVRLVLRRPSVRSLNRVVQHCRDVEACHHASSGRSLRLGVPC